MRGGFRGALAGDSSLTRQLSAQLTVEHDLTLSDFEVLLRLSRAPDRQMRRVDLADQVLLSPSGVTRLLDGLERHGIRRAGCLRERSARRLRGAHGRRARTAPQRGREPFRPGRRLLRRAARVARARVADAAARPARRGRERGRGLLAGVAPSRRGSSASTGSASARAVPGTSSPRPLSRTGLGRRRSSAGRRSARSSSPGRWRSAGSRRSRARA